MKDGGPAFPVPERRAEDEGRVRFDEPGMSLRDWFAGQAMSRFYCGSQAPDWIAAESYRIADAMLAEREKR
ncbi:MAG: hypothetical protein PHF64_00095 [Methanoregula sp.]|nr:hypothetical protein [Methanoregula sp.]